MWTGSDDALTRVLESMDARTFEEVARNNVHRMPPALKTKTIAAMREFVEMTTDHPARLRTALNLIELGEPATDTARPNTPPPSLTCLIARSNARCLSLAASVEPLLKSISSPILRALGLSDCATAGSAAAPVSNIPAAPSSIQTARPTNGVLFIGIPHV